MRATVYHAAGDVRVENVPDPVIQQPTDAVVRITHACICGSDLWFYRGEEDWQPGWRTGHEWMGIVEDVEPEVRTVKRGDRVLACPAHTIISIKLKTQNSKLKTQNFYCVYHRSYSSCCRSFYAHGNP